MIELAGAESLAAEYLAADQPRRWLHVRAVARRARQVGSVLGGDRAVLIAAAWLHDIGYAGRLADTGFHPLDGARFLRRVGVGDRVVCLVAHHTCAMIEADERGRLGALLEEFPREESPTADMLWYCDPTTGCPTATG